MLNGKLYKYCPISDTTESTQYSIDNLKNSIIYLSKITSFNDPFDTYISFSIDEIMQGLILQMLNNNSELDENTMQVINILFNSMNSRESPVNNPLAKYIVRCIKRNPNILTNENSSEALLHQFSKLLIEDLINGSISEEELNTLSSISNNPNLLITNVIQECISDPQLMKNVGVPVDEDTLIQMQEVFNGNSPEIKAISSNYREIIDSTKPQLSKAIIEERTIIDEKYYVTCFSTSSDTKKGAYLAIRDRILQVMPTKKAKSPEE